MYNTHFKCYWRVQLHLLIMQYKPITISWADKKLDDLKQRKQTQSHFYMLLERSCQATPGGGWSHKYSVFLCHALSVVKISEFSFWHIPWKNKIEAIFWILNVHPPQLLTVWVFVNLDDTISLTLVLSRLNRIVWKSMNTDWFRG